jgi:hypothetical protein
MKINLWQIVSVIVLIGIISLFAYYFYFQQSAPSMTAKRFHEKICNGETDEAAKLISSSLPYTPEMLRLGLGSLVKDCKENGGFESVVIESERIVGETAYVRGTLKHKGSIIKPFDMKMFNENGAWKIALQDKGR